MELLWEKQMEANELRDKYLEDIKSGKFTLGYALTLGFYNMSLRLSNGETVEIGWLNTDAAGNKKYSGSCTDLQLMTLVDLDEIYEDEQYFTCIVVKCHNKEDEERFMKGEE